MNAMRALMSAAFSFDLNEGISPLTPLVTVEVIVALLSVNP